MTTAADWLLRFRKPLVAVASAGAVVSGLVGYYTAYRTVTLPDTLAALPSIESDPSVAVLPLVNLSSDKEQEYFSDGLSEELLNLLSKVPKLRVIARTSSFSFKGKDLPVEAIARKLNVASVLEGSVRRSADTVRIQLDLVRASDSSRLWSATYDRSMKDIFAVQDEIAAAVVDQLKGKILGAAPKAKPMDPRVHELWLKGTALYREGSVTSLAASIETFRKALAIAPREPRLHSGLAAALIIGAEASDRPLTEGYAQARRHAAQAIALDPSEAFAHAMLGRIAVAMDRNYVAAAAHYGKALALDPADTVILSASARLLHALGREDEALSVFRYALARDPANHARYMFIAGTLARLGRWQEALVAAQQAQALSPSTAWTFFSVGYAQLYLGDARAALQQMQLEPYEGGRLIGLAMAHHALGDAKASNAALSALQAKYEKPASYNIAAVYAFRGETDKSFEWLEKAIAYHDTGLTELPNWPDFSAMHKDPRWLPLLRRLGNSPEQLATISFKVDLPK